MKNYNEVLTKAKELYKELNHWNWDCDPEDYLIDLQVDIEVKLEEIYGENDYSDIASEAIYGC